MDKKRKKYYEPVRLEELSIIDDLVYWLSVVLFIIALAAAILYWS
jgi:hypothetical protein